MTTEPLEPLDDLEPWVQRLRLIIETEIARMPLELIAEGEALLELDPDMPRGIVGHTSGDGWLHLTWTNRHIASVRFADLMADDAEPGTVGESS